MRRKMPIRRSAFPGRSLHIPHLERRPASGAEPAGRRGTVPVASLRATVTGCGRGRPRSQGETGADAPEDADQEIGVPRGAVAYSTPGEAPGLGRGAHRATGSEAYVERWPTRTRMRAGRPRSQGETGANAPEDAELGLAFPGGLLHIPRLERRPASGAEPAGRRGAKHTSSVGQRAPGCGRGRPRSQGGPARTRRKMPSWGSAFPGGGRTGRYRMPVFWLYPPSMGRPVL
jgi:hypothetical protein